MKKARDNDRLPRKGAEFPGTSWLSAKDRRYALDFKARYVGFGVGVVHVVDRKVL